MEEIGTTEAALEKRLDGAGLERVGGWVTPDHGDYTNPAVQPTVPSFRLSEERVPVPILQAYRKLGDLALVAKAKAGDAPALHVLVERHAPRVNRLAGQLMGDLEDARDAAQESLVKLCTKLRQFRGEAQFTTWLHRLVVNTCRDAQERTRLHADRAVAAARRGGGGGRRPDQRDGARRSPP